MAAGHELRKEKKMKSYEFRCGEEGWDCLVDAELTEEEEAILKAHAQENDFVSAFPPTEKIWDKVMLALEEQCDEDADLSNVTIRIPVGMRDI